jgi:hypothetical protein
MKHFYKYISHFIFLFLLVATSTHFAKAQVLYTQKKSLKSLDVISADAFASSQSINLKLKGNNNFTNFPFSFEVELAGGNSLNSGKFQPGFITSIELNLFKKTCFLKLEYGRFFQINSSDVASNFGSLGINYKIFKIKKNTFSIHAAVFAIGHQTDGAIGAFFSIRHVLTFNKYIGLVSSLKYPFGSFKTIMLTLGIQFFTN